MLTRRSLLQAAAVVLTGGAVAPPLVAADPVATEYGRLGRARYIFPLQIPNPFTEPGWHSGKLVWNDDGNAKQVPMLLSLGSDKLEIPTLLAAHAPIAVIEVKYDFDYLWHDKRNVFSFKENYGHWPVDMKERDSLQLTATLRDIPPGVQFTNGRVTVHGIVSKQDAPSALRPG